MSSILWDELLLLVDDENDELPDEVVELMLVTETVDDTVGIETVLGSS